MSRRRRMVGLVAVVTVLAALTFAMAHFRQTAGDPVNVDGDLWTDTVKRGTMIREVRGAGTLVRAEDSSKLSARVTVSEDIASDLRLNQKADVDTRKVMLQGRVIYIDPSPSNDRRSVDIVVKSGLPKDVVVGQEIDATIHLGRLEDILYVGRPVHAHQYSTLPVFKLVDDGQRAVRVVVKFGRASVNVIEVMDGLKEGDRIMMGDMSTWDDFDQIRLR